MTTESTALQGKGAERQDVFVKELKGVVSDAEAMLEDLASSTAEGLSSARYSMQEKMGEARSRLEDLRSVISGRAHEAADQVDEFVKHRPWQVLGGAVVVGFVVGLLLRRH